MYPTRESTAPCRRRRTDFAEPHIAFLIIKVRAWVLRIFTRTTYNNHCNVQCNVEKAALLHCLYYALS